MTKATVSSTTTLRLYRVAADTLVAAEVGSFTTGQFYLTIVSSLNDGVRDNIYISAFNFFGQSVSPRGELLPFARGICYSGHDLSFLHDGLGAKGQPVHFPNLVLSGL